MSPQFTFKLLFATCLAVLFTACQTLEHSTDSTAGDEANQLKNVVVLCDVSRSVDTSILAKTAVRNRFREMISQCQSVLTAYPPNTMFSFYFISRNGNAAPFARMKSENVTKLNGAAIKKKFKNCKAWLAKSITRESGQPESQSCIMTSIETAYHSLQGSSQNNMLNSDLLVISDMVEVCWASPVDTLVMNTKGNRALISPWASAKLAAYKPGIDFSKENINVKILFNAGTMDIIKVKQLEKTWSTIFEKYRYKVSPDQLFLTNYIFEKDKYYVSRNLNF